MADASSECSDDSFEIVSAETCEQEKDDVLRSSYKPLVNFYDIFDVYPVDSDIVARVTISEDYEKSADDTVNIMPLAWTSADQAFCSAKLSGDYVKFDVNELPSIPNKFYQLCYTSKEDTIVGVSAPFSFRNVHEDELIECKKEQNKDFWAFRSRFAVLMQIYWNSLIENKRAIDVQHATTSVLESAEPQISNYDVQSKSEIECVEEVVHKIVEEITVKLQKDDTPIIAENSIEKACGNLANQHRKMMSSQDIVNEPEESIEEKLSTIILNSPSEEELIDDSNKELLKPSEFQNPVPENTEAKFDQEVETPPFLHKKIMKSLRDQLNKEGRSSTPQVVLQQSKKFDVPNSFENHPSSPNGTEQIMDYVEMSKKLADIKEKFSLVSTLQDPVLWPSRQNYVSSRKVCKWEKRSLKDSEMSQDTASREIEAKTETMESRPCEEEKRIFALQEEIEMLRTEVDSLMKQSNSYKKKLCDTHSDLDYFKKLYIDKTEEMRKKEERFGAQLTKLTFEKEKLHQEKSVMKKMFDERLNKCAVEYGKLMFKYNKLRRAAEQNMNSDDGPGANSAKPLMFSFEANGLRPSNS